MQHPINLQRKLSINIKKPIVRTKTFCRDKIQILGLLAQSSEELVFLILKGEQVHQLDLGQHQNVEFKGVCDFQGELCYAYHCQDKSTFEFRLLNEAKTLVWSSPAKEGDEFWLFEPDSRQNLFEKDLCGFIAYKKTKSEGFFLLNQQLQWISIAPEMKQNRRFYILEQTPWGIILNLSHAKKLNFYDQETENTQILHLEKLCLDPDADWYTQIYKSKLVFVTKQSELICFDRHSQETEWRFPFEQIAPECSVNAMCFNETEQMLIIYADNLDYNKKLGYLFALDIKQEPQVKWCHNVTYSALKFLNAEYFIDFHPTHPWGLSVFHIETGEIVQLNDAPYLQDSFTEDLPNFLVSQTGQTLLAFDKYGTIQVYQQTVY